MPIDDYRKYLVPATIISILILCLVVLSTETGKLFIYEHCSNVQSVGYFCPNIISFEVSGNLDQKAVVITINNPKNRNKTISKPDKIYWLSHDYGFDIFTVYYQKKMIGKATLFNTNSWHGHIYKFVISEKSGEILVSFTADGPDGPGEFVYKKDLRLKNA